MAELADALDLGSSSERSEGSSPFIRTFNLIAENCMSQQAHAVNLSVNLSSTARKRVSRARFYWRQKIIVCVF